MTGAVAALVGDGGAGASSGGTPGAVTWGPMYGIDSVASNTQTLSGFTGTKSISAALSGGGILTYLLNGAPTAYTGAFTVHNGDTLAWAISVGHVAKAGNLTVTNVTDSTTLATIVYAVDTSWDGTGYR